MSGHSHFRTIRHKKELEDKKRSKIFSKLSRLISVAARKGADPETNTDLKRALEEARKFNMPKENIERAIKRGTGELEGEQLEEVSIEALLNNGIYFIVEGITDNKNRTLLEVKQIFQKYNGKIADQGSVKWLFTKKGCVTINKNEQPSTLQEEQIIELKAIEAGAEDIQWDKNKEFLDIFCAPEKLKELENNLKEIGFIIESASLDWIPNEKIQIPQEKNQSLQQLIADLEENDAIQNIYTNADIEF